MRTLGLLMLSIFLGNLAISQNVFAKPKSECRQRFEHNIRGEVQLSKSLSAACWAQVKKGERNEAKIRSTCNNQEVGIALDMRQLKRNNTRLCRQEECQAELDKLQVCVDHKPLDYYVKRLGL